MKRSGLGVLLALVVLGAAGWFLFVGGAGGEVDSVAPGASRDVEAAGRTTAIDGPALVEEAGAAQLDQPVSSERELVAAELAAQLDLELVHALTGEPVSGTVHLWRIGAPETEDWSAGDVQVARVSVEAGAHRFADLVAGTYRLHAALQVRDADPLPAFEVVGGANRVRFEVVPAERHALQVALVDHGGQAWPERVEFLSRGSTIELDYASKPTWARERRQKGSAEWLVGMGGGGGSYFSAHPRWREFARGELGFELGQLHESSADRTYRHKFELRMQRSEPMSLGSAPTAEELRSFGGDANEPEPAGSQAQPQRFENTLEIVDTGAEAYVAVVVDPATIVDRLEGVAEFERIELYQGLSIRSLAAPLADGPGAAYVVVELRLAGQVRLRTRWYAARDPMPRFIALPQPVAR